jgi:hypothetical protein
MRDTRWLANRLVVGLIMTAAVAVLRWWYGWR